MHLHIRSHIRSHIRTAAYLCDMRVAETLSSAKVVDVGPMIGALILYRLLDRDHTYRTGLRNRYDPVTPPSCVLQRVRSFGTIL